jgi:[ribosomal protein S5]-alanine N-acetyltransferase
MEILFEGIILRPWSIEDAPQLAEIANNRNIADNVRDLFPFPYSIRDARKWLRSILPANAPPLNFAVVIDNVIAGNIGLLTKDDIYIRNIEIGYFISEKFWGQGIATRAIKAVTSYAFSNFDIVRVYAETFADNVPSRRALEKSGFVMEAVFRRNIIKNGIIKDSCIYSVLKEDFRYFLKTD